MRNFKKQNFIEITQNEFQKYSNSIITDYEAFEAKSFWHYRVAYKLVE